MSTPRAAGGLDRRLQHALVFVAEQAVFAGVRIQAGQRQPRRRHAKPRQLARSRGR